MSYLGYIKTLCEGYLAGYEEPKVLEIGIDKGQTALPLIHNLSLFERFSYVGLDIIVQDLVLNQLGQYVNVSLGGLDKKTGRDAMLLHVNSLTWLELNQQRKTKFDMVLVDGDHNYKTVSQELKLIQAVIHPMSIIVCDDYGGQWSETDLYYADRPEYAENEKATQREESERQGVRTAVDDFLKSDTRWSGCRIPTMEPIILYRNDVWETMELMYHNSGRAQVSTARDMKLMAKLRQH